ncbi:MAG: RsmG family class I SAM-dependent methyltransferase [Pseudobdellovibrio sp.]
MSLSEKKEHPYNWRLKTWFPELSDIIHSKFETHFDLIIKNNSSAGLIPSKTLLNCDLVHFADSINASHSVFKKINKNEALYDFGSGSGFPGLVYSVLYPDQKIILVEENARKVNFLKETILALKLTNVSVVNLKVDLLPEGSVFQAICRGYKPLPLALLSLRKIVKTGGVVFHLKADEWSQELSEIPSQLCSSWLPGLVNNYQLPITDINLFIIRTDKI